MARCVNVWFADRGPAWKLDMDLGNQDLALLTGYKLKLNWNVTCGSWRVGDAKQKRLRSILRLVAQTARIPETATVAVAGNPDDKRLWRICTSFPA